MKVAIIADIHENFHNLLKALEIIQGTDVAWILCLGDLINGGIAQILAESGLPVTCIWGNNDGDKMSILSFALAAGSTLRMEQQSYGFVELDGRKLFLTHYPNLADPMAKSQEFDAVFYGHDHLKSEKRIGSCLVVNPGELSSHKTGTATFAIYDTIQNQVEFVQIPDLVSQVTSFVFNHPAWRRVHQELLDRHGEAVHIDWSRESPDSMSVLREGNSVAFQIIGDIGQIQLD
jgi:uncharacterized protein